MGCMNDDDVHNVVFSLTTKIGIRIKQWALMNHRVRAAQCEPKWCFVVGQLC